MRDRGEEYQVKDFSIDIRTASALLPVAARAYLAALDVGHMGSNNLGRFSGGG